MEKLIRQKWRVCHKDHLTISDLSKGEHKMINPKEK